MKIKRVLDSINSRSLSRLHRGLYHLKRPGRKPYNPLSILKAPLLKLWDGLARRHKLLPYTVMLLGLVFLVFAVWYLWRWISFGEANLRI